MLGRTTYTLKAEFQTAQAVTPGQGQAVTIAGAKIGEIASVDLHNGVAIVTMKVHPEVRALYRNATLLLRPKTQLQDITVEVNPGTPVGRQAAQRRSAPPVADRAERRLRRIPRGARRRNARLPAGAARRRGHGLKDNGKALSATLKRFDPAARYTQEIAQQLELRHANIARSIHNFRLLMEALGGKDKQLAELVDASNAVFATFAKEEANLRDAAPAARRAAQDRLGPRQARDRHQRSSARRCTSSIRSRSALGPANEATRRLSLKTTPIIKNEIRPFAREILPVVNELRPPRRSSAKRSRNSRRASRCSTNSSTSSPTTPGRARAASCSSSTGATTTSTACVSTADAHGAAGPHAHLLQLRSPAVLKGAGEVNANVNLLVGLLSPPTKAECISQGILDANGTAEDASRAGARGHRRRAARRRRRGGIFVDLRPARGGGKG